MEKGSGMWSFTAFVFSAEQLTTGPSRAKAACEKNQWDVFTPVAPVGQPRVRIRVCVRKKKNKPESMIVIVQISFLFSVKPNKDYRMRAESR